MENSLAESIEKDLQPESFSITSSYLKQIVSFVEISLHLGYSDNIFILIEDIIWAMMNDYNSQNSDMVLLWSRSVVNALRDEQKQISVCQLLQAD